MLFRKSKTKNWQHLLLKDEGVDDDNREVNNDNDGDTIMMMMMMMIMLRMIMIMMMMTMMMKTAIEDVTCGSATVKGPLGPRV